MIMTTGTSTIWIILKIFNNTNENLLPNTGADSFLYFYKRGIDNKKSEYRQGELLNGYGYFNYGYYRYNGLSI